MPKLHNIQSVAKYESKLLMRSWFYRIFLVLAILFLCIFNFAALVAEGGGFWLMKALPANIPYVNLMFLNTGQAIIAVFLSSEFLKSDKKLDTSEVFYVHPLSNAEYVTGKIWGNMGVFIRLDLFIIVLVVAFNLISGVSIDWMAYLVYFLLICIPTLIYIFGLSIGLMLVLKSQAITFVLLLGYIALTLFYIGDKFYYLFDYMVYNLPLVKSTIIGFSNWGALINHRMIYLLLGSGFICLSIFLFRRLPNTKYGSYRWLFLSLVFVSAGIWASYNHVVTIMKAAKMRQIYTEVNNQYVNTPKMVIDHYDISLDQHPQTISSEVEMRAVALEEAAVFTFCLNPGLKVSEVTENNKALSFTRDHQILLIDFGREIESGDSVRFKLKYAGSIDEGFCYLDIPAEILQEEYASEMFKIDKKYSFQDKNYLLFTPETYWYPRPGTSYSSENPDWQQAYFSHFRLKVKTINDLKALSQGTMKWPVVKRITVDPDEAEKGNRELTAPAEDNRADRVPGKDSTGVSGRDSERRPGGNRERRPGRNRDAGSDRSRERDAGDASGDGVAQNRGQRANRNTDEGGGPRRERVTERGAEGRGSRGERGSVRGEGGGSRQSGERGVPRDSAAERDKALAKISPKVITEVSYDSIFIYETDFLTPSITLIIGDYEQKSIDVDKTLFSIWHLKGHDYFSTVFNAVADTIPAQIRERRRSVESAYYLDYSFSRFSLVEVPVQFYNYVRTWTQAQEVMQPEMVLFPERGSLINDADVVKGVQNEKNRAKRDGQEISDEEAAIRVLNRFMRLFERTESNFNWSQDRGSLNVSVKPNAYFVFPQLYNFRYNVFSSEWPVANRLIELYLQDKVDNNDWVRQMNGISNDEKANLLMEQSPFKELLADAEQRNLLDNVTALKANYLFAPAERNVGYEEYRDSLRAVLQRNIFTNLRFENLLDTMGMIAGVDLRAPLEAWYHPTPLPVYIVGTPEVIRIMNRDKEVFVVKLLITNDSDHDGVVNIEINMGGGLYDPRAKRKVTLKAHETKNLVSVWDEAPRNININTLISANLPSLINLPVNNIIRERNKPIDEEGDFVVENASYKISGEVIVDNEDSTLFVLSLPDVVGLLPQWLDRVDDNSFRYSGVSGWRPPLQWTLTTNDKYYGTHVRSAYVIKSGSGSQTATWKIPVADAGQYDLYYYVYKPDEFRRGRGRGPGGGGRGRSAGDAEYHFKVRYDDDEENAYINLQRSEEGWSILGTYFFSNDTVQVILSNNCKLRTVTADAVKIVRR
ncbi:xanthan lyase [uncultured Proteiniphilum sp.]|uniref:xanthan lyase n=1 Tax=uncultured Proteiniphilum sp. TaxID=497637 RepID=UPI002607D31C|nr:xanthan lyase [uncultured Proteiniphilum sp.]